jgi:integrase
LDPAVSAVQTAEAAMGRKVRDSNLETRTARSRLPVRHKPYFRLIEPGLHIGYRKLISGPGTWPIRRLVKGRYVTENLRTPEGGIVIADDFEDADSIRIMSFAQAQRAARGAKRPGAYTGNNAADDYLQLLESSGRPPEAIRDARYTLDAFFRPHLGNTKAETLTTDRLRRWLGEIAKTPPRLRTRDGEKQKYREMAGEDAARARRNSARRVWNTVRAALNYAFEEGKIESDLAWRKLKNPFRNVDTARIRYLTIAESNRLINACAPAFRPLVEAGLQSGCRYGELCRLQVHDFNPDAGTLAIQRSKSGNSRHVILSEEGRALFAQLTAGRSGAEPMFGKIWRKSQQIRPMAEAVERAKIKPRISFHGLRHTWASHAVMGGMPLMVVARNLGHADTRMVEKHYGHLAPDFVADAVRRHAPKFGLSPSKKIVPLPKFSTVPKT